MLAVLCTILLLAHSSSSSALSQFSGRRPAWHDQMIADAKKITVDQVNQFHQRFVERCMPLVPERFEVQYLGVVSTDNGRLKMRVRGDVGLPLSWAIQQDVVLFSFWISTKPTEITLAKCDIDGVTFYVNVDHIDKNRGPDDKLPELGSRSIRTILAAVETTAKKGN